MENKKYLAILHQMGITQNKMHLIFENNINYKKFYENINLDILIKYGFNEKQALFILENKKEFKLINIEKKIAERKVRIITILDKEYPDYLKEISNPPYIFYLRGVINNSPKISIVGSRKITNYGISVIEKIIPELSNYFCIVSGGAAGCDTFAHKVTIESGNKTLSVIGTGIDIDYPVSNKKMYDEIVEKGGGVISIFPIGEVGNPYNFPVRNEIVAGLSVGTLIIEAQSKSGTLITANLALDMGKDLFVVPGDIFRKNSEGCNKLIMQGSAKLITSSEYILNEYNIGTIESEKPINKINFNDNIDENIYNILFLDNLTIDELSKKINLDIPSLSFRLSMMEINKVIKKTIGGKYQVF